MPDRQLPIEEAAERAGVTRSRWRTLTNPVRARGGKVYGPPPDGHWPCGCPWWWESTVDTFQQGRSRT